MRYNIYSELYGFTLVSENDNSFFLPRLIQTLKINKFSKSQRIQSNTSKMFTIKFQNG